MEDSEAGQVADWIKRQLRRRWRSAKLMKLEETDGVYHFSVRDGGRDYRLIVHRRAYRVTN